MQTNNYEAIQISNQKFKKIEDVLVVEAALQININNAPFTVVMRTPGDDFELIRGLLYAEDVYKDAVPLEFEIVKVEKNNFCIINVTIPENKLKKGYLNKRTLLSVASCGICGKQKLEDLSHVQQKLDHSFIFNPQKIESMFALMKQKQTTFEISGGSHAAAIFDENYNLLVLKEDIGRHNAVDKVVGALINSNKLKQAASLFVSGRVSYEIISKAFFAKIPTVVAISACSTLSVDFAKEFGICLIGFSRGNNATIYSKKQ